MSIANLSAQDHILCSLRVHVFPHSSNAFSFQLDFEITL